VSITIDQKASAQGNSAALTATYSVNPAAGDKVVVAIWAFATANPSSVKDNGTSVTTFTLDRSKIDSTNGFGLWVYYGDNVSMPASGAYKVTVTFGSTVDQNFYCAALLGAATGASTATASAGPTTSTAPSSGATGTGTGNYYIGLFSDATSLTPETINNNWTSSTRELTQTNGSTQQAGACNDLIGDGSQTAAWSIGDSVAWDALLAVYAAAPSAGTVGWQPPQQLYYRLPSARSRALFAQQTYGSTGAATAVANVVTATDSLTGLTDTATRGNQSFLRTSSDTLTGLSETVARLVTLLRSPADTVSTPTDSAARASQGFTRTATDTLASLSESVVRAAQSFLRSISDTLTGLTDSASRSNQAFTRSPSDTLTGLTDSAARSNQAFSRSPSDSLTSISDSAARSNQSFLRSISDTLTGLTDSATGLKVLVRTATDTLTGLTDSLTRAAMAFLRSPSDSLTGLTDTVARAAQPFLRTASENLTGLTDSASGLKILVRTAADTLTGLTEALGRQLSLPRTATDSLTGLAETAVRAAQSLHRSLVDTLAGLTDTASSAGPNSGKPVAGPTRLLGAVANILGGLFGANRNKGGGPNNLGG